MWGSAMRCPATRFAVDQFDFQDKAGRDGIMERLRQSMKAVKELTRILCKVVGGIAALVFIRAPFTDAGLMLMAGSVLLGLICIAGYTWSEPDENPPSSEDSN